MKVVSKLLIPFLLGTSIACAQEREATLALVPVADEPSGGRSVAAADGTRWTLKGRLALAVAQETPIFTIGATQRGRTLNAKWVRATIATKVKLGHRKRKLKAGASVKVVAYQDAQTAPGVHQRRYEVLSGSSRGWVQDYELNFEPASAPFEYARVAGRVEVRSRRPRLATQRNGRLEVLGSLKPLLVVSNKKYVQGYGLLFKRTRKILLTELDATTTHETEVFPRAKPSRDGMPQAAGAPVVITGNSNSRFLELRFNWPTTDDNRGFIRARDVVIGQPRLAGKPIRLAEVGKRLGAAAALGELP